MKYGVVSLDGGNELEAGVIEALFIVVDGGSLGVHHHLLLLLLLHHGHGHSRLRSLHLRLMLLVRLVRRLHSTVVVTALTTGRLHSLGVHVRVAALRTIILSTVLVVVRLVRTLVIAALTLLGVSTHACGELLLEGQGLEELCDLEVELVARGDFVPLRVVVVQLLESLETELILGLFIGNSPILSQFVMADG